MSGWADDYESSIELASEAANQLLRLKPDPDEMKDGKPIPEVEERNRLKMKDRFWQRPEPWQRQSGVIVATVVLSNYFYALKEAIDSIDPTVSV